MMTIIQKSKIFNKQHKKMAKKTKAVPIKKLYKCTIEPELFEQWKLLKRQGDVKLLQEKTNISPPTIIRALTYGYVKKQDLIKAINTLFIKRAEDEKKQAEQLSKLPNGK